MHQTLDVFFQYVLPGLIAILGVAGLWRGRFESWLSRREAGGVLGIACSSLYVLALPICATLYPFTSSPSVPYGAGAGLLALCVLPAEALAWLFGKAKDKPDQVQSGKPGEAGPTP